MPDQNDMLQLGVLVLSGLLMGQVAERLGLPKVTGYILSGIVLNPNLLPFMDADFLTRSGPMSNFALAFITFEVGGTLLWKDLRKTGKAMVFMAIFEAEGAFVIVGGGVFALCFFFPALVGPAAGLALALILGSLGSPTDPSATLAVAHEYGSSGPVTTSVMTVAAFDDVLGIINFSVALALARALASGAALDLHAMAAVPSIEVFGGIAIGLGMGSVANLLSRLAKKTNDSELLILLFGVLALCYGVAAKLGVDPLLSTMTMGVSVVNRNKHQKRIFELMEQYTESLIFVLFFGLGAMHLDFSVLRSSSLLIVLFVLLRAAGKIGGAKLGGRLGGASAAIRKDAPLALIPQGGIVIGLALTAATTPGLEKLGKTVVGVVIGTTIIHEIIGPVLSRFALRRAGELPAS